jgi:hypothetical protein
MSARKSSGVTWHKVEIPIRSDIFDRVTDLHLDLRDECNRALAKITGIDFSTGRPSYATPAKPGETAPVPAAGSGSRKTAVTPPAPLRPVMNAEDPRSPAQVLAEKQDAAHQKPRAHQAPAPVTSSETAPLVSEVSRSLADTTRKSPAEKRTKENTIKKYVKTRIARADEESPDTIIPKDELYTLFERWCREQNVAKIPERRTFFIALKNQYAFTDRMIGQKSCFVNIHMR